jgi:hypothetical protein
MKAFFLEAHRIFWSSLILISLLSNGALSQSVGEIDLKDGTVIRGQIVEFKYPSHVLVKAGDTTVRFEWKDILRVNFDNRVSAPTPVAEKPEYLFKDSAFYGTLSPIGLNFGVDQWTDLVAAYSIDAGLGYSFNRRLNIGLNVGHDMYIQWPNYGFFTTTVHTFSRLRGESFTPTMGLIAGYGLPTIHPFTRDDESMQGGLLINPSFGIMKTFRKHASWYANVGYKWQWASAREVGSFWNGNQWVETTSDIKMRFNRLDFRFGFIFQ